MRWDMSFPLFCSEEGRKRGFTRGCSRGICHIHIISDRGDDKVGKVTGSIWGWWWWWWRERHIWV
jgi:hypothetical protein